MAKFNPEVQENQQNYLGYSRGITPDVSTATMISESTQTCKEAVNATVKYYDTRIGEEAREVTDNIKDSYIDALSSPMGMGPEGTPSPPALTRRLDRTTTMSDAVKNGSMRESHFWNLLDAEARAMRAKYPGFKDVVDQHVSKLVGGNPANQTIQNLFNEAKAGQGTEGKELDYWTKKAIEKGVAPDIAKLEGTVAPADRTALFKQRVALFEKQDAEMKLEKEKMSGAKQRGELTSYQAEQSALKEATYKMDFSYRVGFGPYDQIRKITKDIEANRGTFGAINQADSEQLRQAYGTYERQVMDEITGILTKQDEKGFAYTSVLSKEQRANVMDMATMRLKVVKDAIFDKDTGTIGAITQRLDAFDKDSSLRAMEMDKTLRIISVLKDRAGPNFGQLALLAAPENLKSSSQIWMQDAILHGVNPTGPKTDSLSNQVKQLKAMKVDEIGPITKATINKSFELLKNPSLTGELFDKQATHLFGKDNEDFLFATDKDGNLSANFTDPASIYVQMVGDPAVIQRMTALRESNPGVYQNFKNWGTVNFSNLMQSKAADMNRVVTSSRYNDLKWDPETNSFQMVQNKPYPGEGFMAGPQGTLVDTIERYVADPAGQRAVQDVNKVIAGMSALVKAEGGDPKTQIPLLVQKLGVDLGAKKEGPMLEQLGKKMQQGIDETTKQLEQETGGKTSSTATPKPAWVEVIKGFEGFEPQAKWDVRQYSLGYGRKGTAGEKAGTPEQEETKMIQEAKKVDDHVTKSITVPLNDQQKAALVSFGYNLGPGAIDRIKDDLNAGRTYEAAQRMLSFNKADGEFNIGLAKRRQKEAAMMMEGLTATRGNEQIIYRGGRWQPVQ